MTFTELPVELIYRTLSFLSDLELKELSVDFKPVNDLVHKTLYYDDFESSELLLKFLEDTNFSPNHLVVSSADQLKQLPYLKFKYLSVENVDAPLPNFNYKSLYLNQARDIQQLSVEKLIVDGVPPTNHNVKSLEIHNHVISKQELSRFPYLEQLTLVNSFTEQLDTNVNLDLKSLVINDYNTGDLSHFPLKNLEIYNVNSLDNLPPTLESLTIGDGKYLKNLKPIKSLQLKKLKLMMFSLCNIGEFYRTELPESLEELEIEFVQEFYDIYNLINDIPLPKNLKKLIITGDDLSIHRKFPSSLEYLEFNGIFKYSPTSDIPVIINS